MTGPLPGPTALPHCSGGLRAGVPRLKFTSIYQLCALLDALWAQWALTLAPARLVLFLALLSQQCLWCP